MRLNLEIENSMNERLKALARERQCSTFKIVRAALQQYIEQHDLSPDLEIQQHDSSNRR
ncbi:ribbon-helix-helix protein, CopG family [Serratia grimesii]|uniref:ribbon-helix-helix protein, CopG family n=1 Tax=Serratia grimesii TaxID=82995 RepID=UPI00241CD812|nr:ribbon-helix-helix protein, CopG family [Serratia grimesii]